MIKNFKNGEVVTNVRYELSFWNSEKGGGLGFPCDKDGNLENPSKEALANYEWAMAHPEEYDIFNKVEAIENTYREPNSGICHCGEKIFLQNEYMGACQCPNCGQWYNLFGQELLPPEEWEKDY